MDLITRQKEQFKILNKQVIDTPYGRKTIFTEGASFEALAVYQDNTNERIAEKTESIANWLITIVTPSFPLERNDYCKRMSDGKTFKIDIPSNNKKTPTVTANIPFYAQCFAYEWDISTGGAVT